MQIPINNLQLQYRQFTYFPYPHPQDMLAKSHHDRQTDPHLDKIKNVEKNNKKFKKNKNDDANPFKKNATTLFRSKNGNLPLQIKIGLFEKSLSKSKQKSPIKHPLQNQQKMKLSKKLNTTPIKPAKNGSITQRKKSPEPKSKSRSASTSRKNTAKMTHREYNELSPLQNTKKQLFLSGKKDKMSPAKPKPKSKEKKKVKYRNQNKIQKKQDIQEKNQTFQNVEEELTYPVTSLNNQDVQQQQKKKIKKEIPHIRTEFSGRKRSYIDESLLRKLQHHRQNKDLEFIESCFVKSVQQQSKNQESRKQKIKEKDHYITSNLSNKKSSDSFKIVNFRKEQEKKWCSMLQQIKKLKNQTQISDKIDFLIQQITDNYNNLQIHIGSDSESSKRQLQQRLQTKGDELQQIQAQCDLTYPLIPNSSQNQSQSIVEHQNQIIECVKVQQPRSNVISLDDFFQSSENKPSVNLKRDLFQVNQAEHTRASILKEMKEMVKSEIAEMKNEKEVTKVAIKDQNNALNLIKHNNQNGNNQLYSSPNLHRNAEIIVEQICLSLILELCTSLLKNKRLLHYFLTTFDSPVSQHNQVQNDISYLLQPSTNDYACHLMHRILNYLFAHYREYTMKQISYYYQCKPSQILRYVRSTHMQKEQQMSYQIQNQNQIEIPFFNLAKIEEFQTFQLKNTHYVANYFTFNQCVYDLFNDIIDKIRPYGSRGKSIFTLQLSHSLKSEQSIREHVFYRFYESFRYEFQPDFLRQELVHGDEGNFEIIYFVSMQVMECVYNEAILEMYRVMKRRIFQS